MTNTHATLYLKPNDQGQLDLSIEAKGNGVGCLSLTSSIIPPLLIALNSDRRADPSDRLPCVETMPEGAKTPLFAKRGWCGDFLLEKGHRMGSRLWLLERAKRTVSTALAAQDYVLEALKPITDFHHETLSVLAGWGQRNRNHLTLDITVSGQKIRTGVDL